MYKNNGMNEKRETKTRAILEFAALLLLIFVIRTVGFGLYQVPTGSMETTMLVGERFFADKFTPLFSKPKHGDIISFNTPLYSYSKNWFIRLWQNYVWGPDNWTKRVIGIPGDTIKGVIEDGKPVVYRNGEKLDEPYINKYPLIGVWKVDPLKLHELERKVSKLVGNNTSQALLESIVEQALGNSYELRSYDSSVPYDKQPFYRINPNYVFKRTGNGDNSYLLYPDTPFYPHADSIVRKGNSYWSSSDEFYVELGENEYWLMGDNRRGSKDSRYFGPLKSDLIHGKIRFRILSVQPSEAESSLSEASGIRWSLNWIQSFLLVDLILHPIDFWRRVRWSRCLQGVS